MLALVAGVVVWAVLSGGTLFAADPNLFGEVCSGNSEAVACKESSETPLYGSGSVLMTVANLISVAAGIAAVFIIVIAGISYMTSHGDAAKVKTAKDTIIYAAVGLVVVVLARAIIGFVVSKV